MKNLFGIERPGAGVGRRVGSGVRGNETISLNEINPDDRVNSFNARERLVLSPLI